MTAEEETKAIVDSLSKWLPKNPDATVAILVPRNTRGVEVIDLDRAMDAARAIPLPHGREVLHVIRRMQAAVAEAAAATVERAMHDLARSGELRRIYNKWFVRTLPNGERLQGDAVVVHVVDDPYKGGVGLAFLSDDPTFADTLDRYLASLAG
mgnify:CR=1 FL=1